MEVPQSAYLLTAQRYLRTWEMAQWLRPLAVYTQGPEFQFPPPIQKPGMAAEGPALPVLRWQKQEDPRTFLPVA